MHAKRSLTKIVAINKAIESIVHKVPSGCVSCDAVSDGQSIGFPFLVKRQ